MLQKNLLLGGNHHQIGVSFVEAPIIPPLPLITNILALFMAVWQCNLSHVAIANTIFCMHIMLVSMGIPLEHQELTPLLINPVTWETK